MTTQPVVPLSTLNPMGSAYPFSIVFEVETNANNSVDFWKIPKGTVITMVLVEVRKAGTGTATNIIIGDDDEDDGFILNAAAVCGVTVGTIYGASAKERGEYLTLDESTGIHAGHWKVYTDADRELKLKASASLSTEAIVRVYVFGFKLNEA